MLLIIFPAHELAHLLIARLDGAQVWDWSLLPSIKGSRIIGGYVNVNEFSFSSLGVLIIFKLAGFLFTFIPATIFSVFLYRNNQKFWVYPFAWVMAAPAVSGNDFFDVGRNLGNLVLGRILYFIAYDLTALMLIIFVLLIRKQKQSK